MQKRIHPALSKLADLIIREPLLLEQNEAHKKQLYDYWDGLEAVSVYIGYQIKPFIVIVM